MNRSKLYMSTNIVAVKLIYCMTIICQMYCKNNLQGPGEDYEGLMDILEKIFI